MQCSRGHALNGDEKYCSECGEPTRRCSNGHLLTRSAKFCSECGVTTEAVALPANPHLTTADGPRESPSMAPEVPSVGASNTEPIGPVGNSQPTMESDEVVVMCSKCGYEETANTTEVGWQCGRCDANWYVMSCGHCGEAQVVPQDTGRTTCIDCQKPLVEFEQFSEALTIADVEPHGRGFLKSKNQSGVLKDASTPRISRTALAEPATASIPSSTGRLRGPGWRPLTWVILAMNGLFLAWIIYAIHVASTNCNGQTGSLGQACQTGTAIGAGISVGIIVFFWVAVDVILGIIFLVTNRNQRSCPACGRGVKNGLTRCKSCGHAFV